MIEPDNRESLFERGCEKQNSLCDVIWTEFCLEFFKKETFFSVSKH